MGHILLQVCCTATKTFRCPLNIILTSPKQSRNKIHMDHLSLKSQVPRSGGGGEMGRRHQTRSSNKTFCRMVRSLKNMIALKKVYIFAGGVNGTKGPIRSFIESPFCFRKRCVTAPPVKQSAVHRK